MAVFEKHTTGFGSKMLEKMGFRAGLGLGKNEDGRNTHVRITKREDGIGLGTRPNDFTKNWEQMFNSAACNIVVSPDKEPDNAKAKQTAPTEIAPQASDSVAKSASPPALGQGVVFQRFVAASPPPASPTAGSGLVTFLPSDAEFDKMYWQRCRGKLARLAQADKDFIAKQAAASAASPANDSSRKSSRSPAPAATDASPAAEEEDDAEARTAAKAERKRLRKQQREEEAAQAAQEAAAQEAAAQEATPEEDDAEARAAAKAERKRLRRQQREEAAQVEQEQAAELEAPKKSKRKKVAAEEE